MKKILFPTDFSDISKNAFVYALHLAKHIHAEIITLHTYEYPQLNYIDMPVYLPEIYEITDLSTFENYKGHIPLLHEIATQHGLEHIRISNVLETGDLMESITELTQKEPFDYIVMGTKGASGLIATFLGSVTEKVMNAAETPVLAIPEDCDYKDIKRILFTTEYKTEEIAVFKSVLELAKTFHGQVDCLYVKPSHSGVDDAIIANWKKMFAGDAVTFHTINTNDTEGIILNFITTHHIDMLTMTTHHRNFFERIFEVSLSTKFVFHAKLPILGIKA